MLLVTFFLSLAGCKSKQVSQQLPPETNSGGELAQKPITLSGEFQNKTGVMARISCFCGRAGILTQANGEKVQLCFSQDVPRDCASISVTGKYVTKTIDPDPNSPCTSGTLTYLQVREFKCQ